MKQLALRAPVLALFLVCGVSSSADAWCDIEIGGYGFAAPPAGGIVDVRVRTQERYPPTYYPCDSYYPEYRLSTDPFGIVPPPWATTVSMTRDPGDKYLWHWLIEVQPNTTGTLRTGYANVRFLSTAPPGQTGGTWYSFYQHPAPHSIDSVELTQAIQQWQSLSDLKADLALDREPPVPIIAGKPAVLRVYMQQPANVTRVTIEVSGAINASRSLVSQPHCTHQKQRRQSDGCRSADFYFVPPDGNFDITVLVRGTNGMVTGTHDLPFKARTTNTLKLKAVSVCDGLGAAECGTAARLSQLAGFLRKIAPTSWVDVAITAKKVRIPRLVFGSVERLWWLAVTARLNSLYYLNPLNWASESSTPP